jgi:hypothetical protein
MGGSLIDHRVVVRGHSLAAATRVGASRNDSDRLRKCCRATAVKSPKRK